jgi:hypothetical protein
MGGCLCVPFPSHLAPFDLRDPARRALDNERLLVLLLQVDAKGFNKRPLAAGDIEVAVMARPFGARLAPGDETWIEISTASQEMLVDAAMRQGTQLAYTVGRASTSGSYANAQGFLAGTVAALLSVVDVKKEESGSGMSCLVRVEGRVVLKSVSTMKPFFIAVGTRMDDMAPETPSRWDYIERLKQKVLSESQQIQALSKSTAANSLRSKLYR